MTSLLFWIACLLVQKSTCLTSESYESTRVDSQTVEPSNSSSEPESRSLDETKHNPSHINLNEAPVLTTSVNDIECSNTEGCASPINVLNTPTVVPVVYSKITWQPITNKKVTTEATQTISEGIPFINSQYNASKRNDDGGNELDSEVKDTKADFLARISTTVMSTEKLEDLTNPPLIEAGNLMSQSNDFFAFSTVPENASIGTLMQEHAEETSSVVPDGKFVVLTNTSAPQMQNIPHTPSTIQEHTTNESTSTTIQDYTSYSIPLKLHSTSSFPTPVPILFSTSVYSDPPTVIPASQRNADDTFHEDLLTTTETPHVLNLGTTILEGAANFSDDLENVSESSTVANHSDSNMPLDKGSTLWTSVPPIKLMPTNISTYSRSLEWNDESKLKTTNVPYNGTENLEVNTNPPSTVTFEGPMDSESHLQMYTVNVSDKEISEGHGLRRNLSHFIPSTDHPVMTTELQDGHTGSYSTKDMFTMKIIEAITSPNVSGTEFSTVIPQKVTPVDMLDGMTTNEKFDLNPTFESSNSHQSEMNKTSNEIIEHSTLAPNATLPSITSSTTSMDEKELDITSSASLVPKAMENNDDTSEKSILPTEVSVKEKDIFEMPMSTANSFSTEKIIEKLISTTETPYTDQAISMLLSTVKPNLETNPSSEFVVETAGRSNPSVSTFLNNGMVTTKQIKETSSSIAYSSTTPSNIRLTVNKEASDHEATTIEFRSNTDIPSTVRATAVSETAENKPTDTLTEQNSAETKSTRTFTEQSSTTSFKAANSLVTHSTHFRWVEAKEESTSTILPPSEQTASAPPTPLIYLRTTPTPKSPLPTTLTPNTHLPTTLSPKTYVSTLPIEFHSVSTHSDTEFSNETHQSVPTTNSTAPDYSMDKSASTTVIPTLATNITSIKDDQLPSFSSDSPVDFSRILTTLQSKIEPSETEADATVPSTTTSNIPFYSTLSTTQTSLTQTETRRGGKHIPFSTVSTKKETVGFSENGIIRITTTDVPPVEDESKVLYNQIQFDELTLTEKANIITATIPLSSKHLNAEEMQEKMMKVHNWLLHVLMKEFQNWTRDPFEETKDDLNVAPFGNISIFYISPTPEMNSSGITLTFVVYNVWKNETLQVDFVLGILNYYRKELKESINASAAYFYHGYVGGDHYLMSAILERYGVIIVTICLAVVLILLLVCVVVFYRKKTRRSVHCLSNSKFKQNMQEAVGIDLNPAIVILQDEKNDKVGNGNKICDDEGWLAPLNDVPQAEDTNVPFIQDTKL